MESMILVDAIIYLKENNGTVSYESRLRDEAVVTVTVTINGRIYHGWDKGHLATAVTAAKRCAEDAERCSLRQISAAPSGILEEISRLVEKLKGSCS